MSARPSARPSVLRGRGRDSAQDTNCGQKYFSRWDGTIGTVAASFSVTNAHKTRGESSVFCLSRCCCFAQTRRAGLRTLVLTRELRCCRRLRRRRRSTESRTRPRESVGRAHSLPIPGAGADVSLHVGRPRARARRTDRASRARRKGEREGSGMRYKHRHFT